jgi:ketosteroid isomerase-like protein
VRTTDCEDGNVRRLQHGFEAWWSGETRALADLLHPDAVWTLAPAGVLKGHYRGRDQIAGHFAHLAYETAGSFRCRALDIAGGGESIFVRSAADATRGGATHTWESVLLFTFVDGLATRVHQYLVDYPAFARFWA